MKALKVNSPEVDGIEKIQVRMKSSNKPVLARPDL